MADWDILSTIQIAAEISWRLPWRVIRAVVLKFLGGPDAKRTSLKLAASTAIFAPILDKNWHVLLRKPWGQTDVREGLLFPSSDLDQNLSASTLDDSHGFHGYLYTSSRSPDFGTSVTAGADALWIHVHGGGFYAGEARQYHHCYMRWVNKAYTQHGMDLRVLAVEYRKLST